MEAGKQRETIVPDKENRDSKLCLRTEYARIKHRVHVHIPRHSFHNDIKTTSIYLHVTSAHKSSIPNPLDTLDDSGGVDIRD